jgi:radical SAM protein (TIGR04043 family)
VDAKHLKVELQSLGVRWEGSCKGRAGGAGPAEGSILLFEGTYASVPVRGPYVSESPYRVEKTNGRLILRKGEAQVREVRLPAAPRFYTRKTRDGIGYGKIALLHGVDCLASTVVQRCANWSGENRCAFCGIHLSLRKGATILRKTPEWLGEVAESAVALDNVRHVTLTSGAFEQVEEELDFLASCTRAIKARADIPVHIQCMPPQGEGVFDRLRAAGADTVGLHIESFDGVVLKRVAPAKAAIGVTRYVRVWKEAVAVFGRNQVSSFVIVGLGESRSSVVEGGHMLCELGVYPFIVPLRPIAETPLGGVRPPHPSLMVSIYEAVVPRLLEYGLSASSSQAGCVRCGACSALPDFEE